MNACDSVDRVRGVCVVYACFGLSLTAHAALVAAAMALHARDKREPPKPTVWVVAELAPAAPSSSAAAVPANAAAHAHEQRPAPTLRTKRYTPRRVTEYVQPTQPVHAHPDQVRVDTHASDAPAEEPTATDMTPTQAPSYTSESPETSASPRLSRFPTAIRQVKPEYPAAARRDHIEGVVRVEVRLDTQGRVVEPLRILKSIPELDAAALAAIRRWLFTPAHDEHGVAVPAVVQIPLRFVLR